MQKLHDLESEEKVNNITHKSRKVEYEKMNSTTESKSNKNEKKFEHITCYICRMKGHFATDCLDKKKTNNSDQKCENCGKKDHLAKDCWSNNKKGANKGKKDQKESQKPQKSNRKAKKNSNDRKVKVKTMFNNKLNEMDDENVDEDSAEESNMVREIFEADSEYVNLTELNDLTLRMIDNNYDGINKNNFNEINCECINLNRDLINYDGIVTNVGYIIDSGATSHMSPYINEFKNFRPEISQVKLGNNKIILSKGRGETDLLKNVMYIPDLKHGLISISKLDQDGFLTIFKDGKVEITDEYGQLAIHGDLKNGLYHLSQVNSGNTDPDSSLDQNTDDNDFINVTELKRDEL
jgi:hypothetical protein